MTIPARGEETLAKELGDKAVTDLVYKFDNDAIPAVFAFVADNPTLTLREAYEHTMEHYCGTWEELSEYLATNLQEKIDEALKEYGERHNFNWQIKIPDLTQMNWGDIADYAEENYYYALRTGFDDPAKAYFIFEVPR